MSSNYNSGDSGPIRDDADNEFGGNAPQDNASSPQPSEETASQPRVVIPPVAEPEDQTPRQPIEISQNQQSACLIIGPSGSGKTTLLQAIGRACFLPGEDDLDLRLTFDPEAAKLMKKPIDMISKDDEMQSNLEVKNYTFWIRALRPKTGFWSRNVESSVRIEMKDGPGGALFPGEVDPRLEIQIQDWQDEIIPTARRANTLVFCVDMNQPRTDLLEAHLPELIAKIAEDREHVSIVPRSERRWRDWMKRTAPRRTQQIHAISMNRFLLLLNKVDQFCSGFDEPLKMASVIDPVAQARDLLGIPLLNMIDQALMPNTQFAVGITSAWGFDSDTGELFADRLGKASLLAGQRKDRALKRWKPFGMRDAIFFITSGIARGTVNIVRPQDRKLTPNAKEILVYPQKKNSNGTY